MTKISDTNIAIFAIVTDVFAKKNNSFINASLLLLSFVCLTLLLQYRRILYNTRQRLLLVHNFSYGVLDISSSTNSFMIIF